MQTNMADESQMEETGNQHLNTNTVIVTPSGIAVEESVSEDILEGDFGDSEEFDQEHVEYAVQAETEDLSQSVAQGINAVSDSALGGNTLESTTQIVAQSNGFGTETYRVVSTLRDGTITLADELITQDVEHEGTDQIDETESGVTLVDHSGQHVIQNRQVLEGQPVLEGQTQILDGHHKILENQNQVLVGQNHVLESQQVLIQQQMQTVNPAHQRSQEQKVHVQQPQQQSVPSVRFTLIDSGNQSDAPLGSSQNPIRIVQQGNNYTPIQSLTSEQVEQIMQVVHQQQVARNTQEAGNSVLFNPSTNTRIVYRIIYPSELHKGQQQTVFHVTPKGTTTTTSSVPVQRDTIQLPKRPYRRRGKEEEDDNKMDGPEMSKEEKEERKKHRPRTRSGRVSKPPKHMVKDYKHIHVLDWDDDYDDSDGGYSDYKGSDEDGIRSKDKDKESAQDLYSGLAMSSARPKNHKCQTCEKSYIGQAGLARHYRLNPSHGFLTADDGDSPSNGALSNSTAEDTNSPVLMNNGSTTITTLTPTLPNSNSNSSLVVGGVMVGMLGGCGASAGTASSSNAGSNVGNLSEDSNTQDSIPSSSGAISPITTTRTLRRGRGGLKTRGRGRWMYHHYSAPARKKQKFKELVKTLDNEDLMEVVLPRLVQFVSLWEFMLMKVETCNASHPRADHIYSEFLALHKHVRRVCQDGLQPLGRADSNSTSQHNGNGLMDTDDSLDKTAPVLKVEDEAIAKSLGLTVGSYEVKDLPVNDNTSFRYKYLTSDPNGPQGVYAQKRTIQVVSPDELVSASPSKRIKTTSLLLPANYSNNNSSSTPSVVTLAPSATAASSLLTSIVSNSGLSGHRQTGGLFRTVAVQQPQSSLLQTVRVQQPPTTSLLSMQQTPHFTLSAQQQHSVVPTSILRTVSVPSQAPTVLRTVAISSPSSQTSLLRLQQPVQAGSAAGAVRQSNVSSGGVVGVSLLNSSSSRLAPVLSQSPSLSMLKSPVVTGGQSSHILVAAAAPSPSVTMAGVGNLPSHSQAARVVSVLPSSSIHTAPLSSLLPQTATMGTGDFQPLGPEDFMDNSDDSLVSSVSGLSSTNSSGLVSAHASLPNGDMPSEVGFSSVVKVNGVSSVSTAKSDSGLSQDRVAVMSLGSEDHGSYISGVGDSLQDDSEEQQLPMVTSAMDSSSTTSLLIKCENGELFTIASTGETIPLTSASVDSVLATGEALPSVSSTVNGLLASSQEEAMPSASTSVNRLLNGSPLDENTVKVEKDDLVGDQGMLLEDDHSVISQADPDPTIAEADMEMEEGVETTSFTFHANATLYQTEDGTIIIQNPDGTSFQLQGIGEQGLTVESVQELFRQMASNSGPEQVQTEMQQ